MNSLEHLDPNISLPAGQEQTEALLTADTNVDASVFDNGEGPSGIR